MSKTLGNVIKPAQLVEQFGVDATRILIVSMFPIGVDGNFSLSEMKDKYNKDLADNFGNLVSRTFGMLNKYFCNKLKTLLPSQILRQEILNCVKNYKTYFEKFELHR